MPITGRGYCPECGVEMEDAQFKSNEWYCPKCDRNRSRAKTSPPT